MASLGSGIVVAVAGYATLGLLGAALVIVPTWLRHLAATPRDQRGANARLTHAARTRAQVSDLVERHVLVGAVGDPHVARSEDDARRLPHVHEHLHVRAVGLAEQGRAAAGHGLDRVREPDRQRDGRTARGRSRTGRP